MKWLRRVVLMLSSIALLVGVVLFFFSIPLALLVLVCAGGLSAVAVNAELASWQMPDPEDPPVSKQSPIEKAQQKMDEAEEFNSRTERKTRIRIDSDDDGKEHDLF